MVGIAQKVMEKVNLWDEKVGKILYEKDFEKWIELNAPYIITPFYDQTTSLNHSDVTFSLEYFNGSLNPHRFAIGAFAPQKTQKAFLEFLEKKAGKVGLEWFNSISVPKTAICSYGIGVDGKRKEWKFYVQTTIPQKAVLSLTVSFDGKALEKKSYSYLRDLDTTVAEGERGKRIQPNVLNGREQFILTSILPLISPELARKTKQILNLGFFVDTYSVTENKNRLALYFEPLYTE